MPAVSNGTAPGGDGVRSSATEVLVDALKAIGRSGSPDDAVTCLLRAMESHANACNTAVFVHDPQRGTLRARWMTVRGEAVDIETDPRTAVWRRDIPEDLTSGWQVIREGEVPFFEAAISDANVWPFSLPWHQQNGHQAFICVPLRVGSTCLGFVALAFDRPRTGLTDSLLELAKAVAHQITLALEVQRLLEAERNAAIARERASAAAERAARAEQLQRMLEGVVAGSRAMLEAEDLDDGLRRWCESIGRTMGCNRAGLGRFVTDPSTGARRASRYCEIQFASGLHRASDAIFATSDFALVVQRLARGDSLALRVEELVDERSINLWAQEQRSLTLLAPIIIDEHAWGWVYGEFAELPQHWECGVGLLRMAADSAASAIRRHEAVREANAQRRLREYAVAEERTRLSREIHDTLAQGLVAALLKVREAGEGVSSGDLRQKLDVVESLLSSTLSEARRSVRALRPLRVERLGFKEALAQLGGEHTARFGQTVTIRNSLDTALPEGVEDELFRIAQEGATNAGKHAGEAELQISVERTVTGGVMLRVVDDGRGFDPEQPHDGHYGLKSIRERVLHIGATMTLISEPGRGTELVVVWQPKDTP